VCRDDVLNGTLAYLGKNIYWNPTDLGINPQDVSDFEWNCVGTTNIIAAKTTQSIYDSRESISHDEAQKYLNFGFVKPFQFDPETDPRVRPGESVIVLVNDENGNLERIIKVQSEAYYWRAMIKGDNPNLFHQFFKLASNALHETVGDNNKENYEKFRKLFPKLSKYSPDLIKGFLGKLRIWPNDLNNKEDYIWTTCDRLYNIWAAFLMTVPMHRQAEVFTFYDRFLFETQQNTQWLLSIERLQLENYSNKDKLHKAVLRIINAARKDAANSTLKAHTSPKLINGVQKIFPNYRQYLEKRIEKLMWRERGFSRYAIMLNRRLLTSKTESEKETVQKEIDSFVFNSADFPELPSKVVYSKTVEESEKDEVEKEVAETDDSLSEEIVYDGESIEEK
jgi:hypothetical protein